MTKPDPVYIEALKRLEAKPELAVQIADIMRAHRKRPSKASYEARLFKYHPVRYTILRNDPLWKVIDDSIAMGFADPLVGTGERVLYLLQHGYLTLSDIDVSFYSSETIEDILCMEGAGDESGLQIAEEDWHEKGEQIFDLSQIAALFSETDASDVPFSAINLPYSSFYIYWGAHLEIPSPISHRYIDGCYVSCRDWGTMDRMLELQFTSSFEPNYPWDTCSLICNVAHDANGSIGLMKSLSPEENGDADPTFSSFYADLDQTGFYPAPLATKWTPALKKALSMAANCLCYLSAENAEVETSFPSEAPARLVLQTNSLKKSERERASSKLASLGFRRIHLCGRATAETLGLSHNTAQMPPHWRRGHWRKQRYGEKLAKTKIIWMSGVLVNAEKGQPATGHIYIADKK